MRLLFFGDAGSIHTARWCRWFGRRGHDVWLATDRPPEERIDAVELLELGACGSPSPARFMWRRHQARNWVRELKPDLAHGHYLQQYGYLAAASSAPVYALTAWGSDVLRLDDLGSVHQRMTRAALKGAALVTVDSADVHRAVVELGAAEDAVLDVVFGVDFEALGEADGLELRNELGIPLDAFVALHMRNLEPNYRPVEVARAMAQTASQRSDFRGVIVGAGSLEAEVREAAAAAPEGRVLVLPRQLEAKVPAFFSSADVFISIPETDGTSVSLLQAMAADCAVIVSDIPANREWIEDDRTGIVLPTGNDAVTTNLAQLLSALAGDRGRAAALGKAASALPALHAADFDDQMARVESAYARIAGVG